MILWVLTLLITIYLASGSVQISSIAPYRGSYEGGTRLTITGSGFERDGQDGSTKVFIGSNLCETIEYYSNDEQIICVSPPCSSEACVNRWNDNQDISVVVISISYNDIIDGGTFYYRDSRTPYLRQLSEPSGAAGDVLTAYGWLREDEVENFYPYVGELICNPGDEDNEDLNGAESSNTANVLHCLMPNNVAGFYNYSLRVHDDYGGYGWTNQELFGYYNYLYWYGTQTLTPYEVTPDGTDLYKVETYATISNISPSFGSVLGGGKVTLSGTGFDSNDWENVEVKIGSLPCTVSSVTETEVVCYTSSAESCNGTQCEDPFNYNSSTEVFTGGRGVNLWIYDQTLTSTYAEPGDLDAIEPDEHYLHDDTIYFYDFDSRDYFFGRLQGYFVPPFTAHYRFYLASDDRGWIYLSTDESRENKTLLCYANWYAPTYFDYADQVSDPVFLVQGQKYFFDAAHYEHGGNAWINAGVEIIGASSSDIPDNTLHQLYNSLPERQVVYVNNVKDREIQDLTLVDVSSGKFFVSYMDTNGNFARSESTVSYAAETSAVVTAVKSVQSCQYISATRTEGYLSDNVTTYVNYEVSFNCPTTSARELLMIESHSLAGGNNLDWYVTRSQEPSVQFGGYFSFGIAGYWTPYLSYTVSQWDLEYAFNDVFRELGMKTKVEVLGVSGWAADGRSYTVDIHGFGDAPDMEVNTTLLTGDLDLVVVEVRNNGTGNPFFEPIPGYFFETIQEEPQVELWVSGKKASCRIGEEGFLSDFESNSTKAGNCPYTFSSAATPTVTALQPETGLIELGTTLTLYGTGFSSRLKQNIIWLGNYSDLCNVTYATPEEVQCEIVLSPPWGAHDLQVQVTPYGYAALSPTLPQLHANLSIFNITPVTGSVWGGNSLTITGEGFRWKNQTEVLIGDNYCDTTFASHEKIICTIPSAYEPSNLASEMRRMLSSTEQNEHGLDTFESISKEEKNIALMDNYNPAFDDGQGLENVFSLLDLLFLDDDRELMSGLDSYSYSYDTGIETDAPTAAPVPVEYVVNIKIDKVNFPDAYLYNQNITPTVTEISPDNVSTAVTTLLTLSGTNLEDTKEVAIGGEDCSVQTSGPTNVTCLLVRSGSTVPTALEGEVNVKGVGLATMGASILRGFSIESVSPNIGSFGGGLEVTLEGHGFSPEYPETHTVLFHGGIQIVTCEVTNVTFHSLKCVLGAAYLNESQTSSTVNVTVTLNDKVSKCSGECEFTFSTGHTPAVESISPSTQSPGSSVMITGTLFTDNTKVYIGNERCSDVTVASSTSLTCTVPYDRFGDYFVHVLVEEYGLSLTLADDVTFSQPLEVLALSALDGSISGGLELIISGYGFSESETETTILFNGHAGSIVSLSHHTLEVLTPSVEEYLVPFDNNVTVVINGTRSSSADIFTFDSSLNYTPKVLAFSPSTGWEGVSLDSKVEIGGEECLILPETWNANGTCFNCSLGPTVYGTHWIYITIAGKGYAQDSTTDGNNLWFTSLLEVTEHFPVYGGVGGGTHVTLLGRGLGSAYIEICSRSATILSSAYNSVMFEVPALSTEAAYRALGHLETDVLVGEIIWAGRGSDSLWYLNAFDGDYSTGFYSYDSQSSTCYLGYEFEAPWGVLISRLRFYPWLQYSEEMDGGWFETSTNGTTWTTLATISHPLEAWNYIDVETPEPVHYIRYRGPSAGRCRVAELEFLGVEVSVTPTCNLTLTVEDNPANFAVSGLSFTYKVDSTPTVTSISPRMGTAMGGTLVTLGGTGFSSDPNNITVTINSFDCSIVFSNDTAIQCETSPRWTYVTPSLSVHVEGKGYAVMPNETSTTTYFRYLDRWSAVTTWANNEPPVDGDTVFVPDGQSVLLDVPSPKLYLLLVQGDMVFDRVDLSLEAYYIFIYGGTFEIGTEDEPFEQNAVVTLYGRRFKTMEIPHVGGKMLAVADLNFVAHNHDSGMVVPEDERGYLDIHGIPRKRTWCKLAQSAFAGDTLLYLAEDVDWEAGEHLVITSSNMGTQAEEVIVSQRLDDRTVEITTELEYDHESNIHFVEGYEIDMRVEVGLLTRNIVIQGDEGSTRDLFGVHTIAAHGAVYRVENAEFTRCGQSFFLGRYCTHMHMASRMDESYVRSNSIHHSFQRAVTIHGSHYTHVAYNVAFDVKGHSFFVEDGAEFYNVIEGNLGCVTRVSEALLKSDLDPSTFWTATPRNIWRHNVATGSHSNGWWIELAGHPGGPSSTTSVCPKHDHLIEFFNNTAHTNSGLGIKIYPQYMPLEDPCDSSSGPKPMYFHNTTSWRNGGNGQFGKKLGSLHWINSKYVENGGAQVHWIKLENEDFLWNPHYLDSVLVGSLTGQRTSRLGVWAPQDEFYYISGITFVNFVGSSAAISGCNACETDTKRNQGAYTYRFDRLKFVNVDQKTKWNWPYKDIFWDLDGTLTDQPNGTVTPYYAFNEHPGCEQQGSEYDYGLICNSSHFPRKLQIYGVEPEELDFQNMVITNKLGLSDTIEFHMKHYYGWCIPILRNKWYRMGFDSTVDFQALTMRWSEPEYVEYHGWDEWMAATFKYIDYREFFEVVNDGRVMPILNGTDIPTPDKPIGSSTINRVNQTWNLLISTEGTNNSSDDPFVIEASALQCDPVIGCGTVVEAPSETTMNRTYWSDAETWGNLGIPQAGDHVVINLTMWVVLDQDTGVLGSLTVYGKLEVEDTDIVLETKKMDVWGFFEVGKPNRPFTSEFELVLHGVRTSPTLIIDNAHFLGNKVLAVLGEMTMVGMSTVTSTRLSTTAEAGDEVIYVDDWNDWQDDQEIVLTSTEYDTTQTETFEIESISDGGKIIELKRALEYDHLAETIDLEDESIKFASAVGMLSRNIKIRGAAGQGERYGASVYVIDASNPDGSIVRAGKVHLENVEFRDTGKHLSEHSSLTFKYAYNHVHPEQLVRGCAFSNSSNYGIRLMDTDNVIIENNTLHNTFRVGIDIDDNSQNAVIRSNLIAGTLFSEDDPDGYILPRSGIHTESAPAEMSYNVIGGSFDAGITFYPSECGTSVIHHNEVHSAKIGAFILWASGCREFISFKAWKISDIGVVSVDQTASNLTLTDIIIADSHIGVSLNFLPPGKIDVTSHITDSVFIGTSALSDCQNSMECRAATGGDNRGLACGSVLGNDNIRRVGIMTPQFTRVGKTCHTDAGCQVPDGRPINMISLQCSMPWENRFSIGLGTRFAELHITDVTFYGYKGGNGSDCGMDSHALINNPSQTDFTPPIFMSGISWQNMADKGKFLLNHKNAHTQSMLGLQYNDGIDMIVVQDLDGTALNSVAGGFFTTNLLLAAEYPYCEGVPEWGGYWCDNSMTLRAAMFESLDSDRGSRRIGPVKITRENGVAANRTYWTAGPIDEMCKIDMHFSQYQFYFQANTSNTMYCTGTNPSNMRFKWFSSDPSESVLLKIWTNKPDGVNVFLGDTYVESSDTKPTLADPAGTNAFDPQAMFIYLTMRGGEEQTYTVRRTPVVQVTFHLAVSSIEFFDEDLLISNLALLLDIDSSRIKVVDVRIGSVYADVEITDDEDTVYSNDDSVVSESYETLTALAVSIVESATSGTLDVGYEVLELSVEAPTMDLSNNTAANSTEESILDLLGVVFVPAPVNYTAVTEPPSVTPTSAPTITVTQGLLIINQADSETSISAVQWAGMGALLVVVLIISTLVGLYCRRRQYKEFVQVDPSDSESVDTTHAPANTAGGQKVGPNQIMPISRPVSDLSGGSEWAERVEMKLPSESKEEQSHLNSRSLTPTPDPAAVREANIPSRLDSLEEIGSSIDGTSSMQSFMTELPPIIQASHMLNHAINSFPILSNRQHDTIAQLRNEVIAGEEKTLEVHQTAQQHAGKGEIENRVSPRKETDILPGEVYSSSDNLV
eukprot:CAMPEP_0117829880 /NCGR_PEP_ID=MMETSP0949-20121206/8130_1 /TAXON_ID=44440 /ORGANISM="Chattonella subsalsa, Strain CCMP2191" /LENGTH=3868 /DNA_ID=CAMNT_0005670717 /DNA_START=230 /DNA_END=11837 /DNA_ORIENTATION=-